MADEPNTDQLLTPAEVAALFRVNPKTVTRWARAGKVTAIRTLGGHRRFHRSEILRCLAQGEEGTVSTAVDLPAAPILPPVPLVGQAPAAEV
ncbi:MAG: BldC family transcriptional regulator [Acidimicrobiales bacterium]